MAPGGNYQRLVDPAWLDQQIDEDRRSTSFGEGLLIIEAGDGDEEKYRTGHIPGAVYLDTNDFERAPSWNVIPVDALEKTLLAHGITSERPVLLYGRDPLAVARTALVLLYAGVVDLRWLAGGIEAWKRQGYELETGRHTPVPVQAFGRPLPAHPEYIAEMGQVRAMSSNPKAAVVCVRTWQEFTGQTSGYDYIQPKGRIAGSIWGGEPGFETRQYGQEDDREEIMHRCQEIVSAWKARGITPDKRIAFYCGTGWRASEAFLCAYLMGWKDVSIYDGGWLEWSADLNNPIESG